MKRLFIFFIFIAAFGFLTGALPAKAEINSRLADIQALREKIEQIQSQISQLAARLDSLEPRLAFGLESGSVKALQTFLRDQGFYPESLITGYFGPLTRKALKRFQSAYNLPLTGQFDFLTRFKINQVKSLIDSARAGQSSQLLGVPNLSFKKAVQPPTLKIEPQPRYDLPAISAAIVKSVNQARIKNNRVFLIQDNKLAKVAEKFSKELAAENKPLVDPQKPCAYPILHHQGFKFGFDVGERLKNSGINYQLAGENLVLFRLEKRLGYLYRPQEISNAAVVCPEVEPLGVSHQSSRAESRRVIKQAIIDRTDILSKVPAVEWAEKSWFSEKEIANEAFNLWWGSKEHKENILNNRFRKTGIGGAVVKDFIIFTQVFSD